MDENDENKDLKVQEELSDIEDSVEEQYK